MAEVYNWFTEGFDTADLQAAQALLERLADKTTTDSDRNGFVVARMNKSVPV
ncbi:MAG: hypothetical protein U0350_34640 [Caldilineaceae bacterium]